MAVQRLPGGGFTGSVDEVMDALGFPKGGPDISGGVAAEGIREAVLQLEQAYAVLARERRPEASSIAVALAQLRPILASLDVQVKASL